VLAAVVFWISFALLILREWKPQWRRALRHYSIAASSATTLLIALLAIAVYQHTRASDAVVVTQQAIVRYGPLEDFPAEILGEAKGRALLFKNLATLRSDAPLFGDVEETRWRGPTDTFALYAEKFGDPRLATRMSDLAKRLH